MKNFHRTNPATPSSTPSPHPSSLWLKLDPRNHNDSMCYAGIAPGLCTQRPEEGQKGKRSVCLLLAAQLKETIKVAYKKKKKKVTWASIYKTAAAITFWREERQWKVYLEVLHCSKLTFPFILPFTALLKAKNVVTCYTLEGQSVQRGTFNSVSSNQAPLYFQGYVLLRVNTVTSRQLWKATKAPEPDSKHFTSSAN